jgi:hypothetical protein
MPGGRRVRTAESRGLSRAFDPEAAATNLPQAAD